MTGLECPAMSDRELAGLRATRIGFVFQQFFLAEHQKYSTTSPTGCCTPGVPRAQRRQPPPRAGPGRAGTPR